MCDHIYHKACITKWVFESNSCPICRRPCTISNLKPYRFEINNSVVEPSQTMASNRGVITRSSNRPKGRGSNVAGARSVANNTPSLGSNNLLNVSVDQPSGHDEHSDRSIREMINESLNHHRNTIMENTSAQINQLVQESVRQALAGLNMNDNASNSSRTQNRDRNQDLNNSPGQYYHYNFSSEKVSNIISNWNVKFSGEEDSMPVDTFIYRIHALTIQTLRGDFRTLCNHIHIVFKDKALDWFWRFHNQNTRLSWDDLCTALKQRFKDKRTDLDIMEKIRSRKQRNSENFDTYYENVMRLTDRLEVPLADAHLVEILKRNLKPETRKAILHFNILSIQHLRKYVHRHEIFEEEMLRHGNFHRQSRAQVSELEREEDSLGEDEGLEIAEVNEFVCWNCRNTGHKFDVCLAERSIFCYGCGAANTYKPQCAKCNSKNLNTKKGFKQKTQSPRVGESPI